VSRTHALSDVARSLCVGAGLRQRGFLDYQCRHGLGHGLMLQTGYDLPLALEICGSLGTGWAHKACAGGVFMENGNTRFGFRSPWLDDEDPLHPCGVVRERDRRSCYLRASWRIYVHENGSYERTAARCARLRAWRATCFQGFGRDVAENVRYAAPEAVELCRVAGPSEADCLLGAARTIANASGSSGIVPASAMCRRAAPGVRASCFAGVGLVLGMLHSTPAARRAACRRVARAYHRSCTAAAEAEVEPDGARAWG
jgi:hypothetical protein